MTLISPFLNGNCIVVLSLEGNSLYQEEIDLQKGATAWQGVSQAYSPTN